MAEHDAEMNWLLMDLLPSSVRRGRPYDHGWASHIANAVERAEKEMGARSFRRAVAAVAGHEHLHERHVRKLVARHWHEVWLDLALAAGEDRRALESGPSEPEETAA